MTPPIRLTGTPKYSIELLARTKGRRSRTRTRHAQILAESVVALTIFTPLIIFMIWAIIEVSYVYVIGIHMTEAAQLAAQALASQFQRDQAIERSQQKQAEILSNIRIPGMVQSNAQFTVESWQTRKQPRSVTVVCTYIPGEGDPPLATFPNPDLFHMAKDFQICSRATHFIMY